MVYNLPVLTVIFLEQEISTGFFIENVGHYIPLTQSIQVSPYSLAVADHLDLIQDVNLSSTLHLSVTHALTLTQEQHPRVYFESVNHILILAQTIDRGATSINSNLVLTQTITVDKSTHVDSVLVLTQEIGLSITHNLEVIHILAFNSSANGYLPDECFINGDFAIMGP